MADYEDIKNQLDYERNKLMKLEIEMNAIDSDSYFYQRNNDLDKLNELSEKKEKLLIQLDSQKKMVENLQSQYDDIKSEYDLSQKDEFKKDQEKIIQDTIEKKKQENFNGKKEDKKTIFKKKEIKEPTTEKKPASSTSSDFVKRCPKCGVLDDGISKFCPRCGNQLRDIDVPKKEKWFVKTFLKKKNDDGTYRLSTSKVAGAVYAFYSFWADLFNFGFPSGIILALISAILAYLICLFIGYIVRWIYNKYIK